VRRVWRVLRVLRVLRGRERSTARASWRRRRSNVRREWRVLRVLRGRERVISTSSSRRRRSDVRRVWRVWRGRERVISTSSIALTCVTASVASSLWQKRTKAHVGRDAVSRSTQLGIWDYRYYEI
jgi:hypothetical protein